jgi:hypothetical protein
MKHALIGLSPIHTTEGKELTLMLITYIITPLHGKRLSEESHRDPPIHFTNVALFADYIIILITEKNKKTSTKRLCSL